MSPQPNWISISSWIGRLGLLLTILPALLFAAGRMELTTVHQVMAAGMCLWFACQLIQWGINRRID